MIDLVRPRTFIQTNREIHKALHTIRKNGGVQAAANAEGMKTLYKAVSNNMTNKNLLPEAHVFVNNMIKFLNEMPANTQKSLGAVNEYFAKHNLKNQPLKGMMRRVYDNFIAEGGFKQGLKSGN